MAQNLVNLDDSTSVQLQLEDGTKVVLTKHKSGVKIIADTLSAKRLSFLPETSNSFILKFD